MLDIKAIHAGIEHGSTIDDNVCAAGLHARQLAALFNTHVRKLAHFLIYAFFVQNIVVNAVIAFLGDILC